MKKGLHSIYQNGKELLMYNDTKISSVSPSYKNNFGLYVNKNKLLLNGNVIAKSEGKGGLMDSGNTAYFGDLDLIDNGICINITPNDYKILYNGGMVSGYKSYSSDAIYNITNSPDTDPVITYSKSGNIITFSNGVTASTNNNVIYDGIIVEQAHNYLNFTKNLNEVNIPFVCVKYFNPIIPIGNTLTIEYYVDQRNLASRIEGDV